MKQIAIVGGGPAGALCGEKLASAGFHVTLFDEHLAWEKPCGGGLTHKAIEKYPFLLNGPQAKKEIRIAELISSKGHRARFEMSRPIVIYSRAVLNGLLLDRAAAAGCQTVHARVTQVETRVQNSAGRVTLTAGGQKHSADFVVLAAGARNQLLPDTTPLRPQDLEVTLGYFIPARDEIVKIKFLDRMNGYLWSFPRTDHLSVGICATMAKYTTSKLRELLDDFVHKEKIDTEGARFYSHVLPSPEFGTLRHRKIVGPNWALAGDAAACVDPITGEGLFYALRSGDLLAQAIMQGQPESYPARLRAEFVADLEIATRLVRLVFRGRFLGDAVTTRMVQFARRSATFRALMCDLFSGAQDYSTLRKRLWKQFGITITEFARDFFHAPNQHEPSEQGTL
ncbi:MAG TPA: NAD(P)/FAD-dependent oxidoreductase [Candidatus Acidoferrales bacterium]|nr:NAD(P)/FAD-dependent oxidoreductase [Candidatus Acidoferrales bacterium]